MAIGDATVTVLLISDQRHVDVPRDDMHLSEVTDLKELSRADLFFEDGEPLLDLHGDVAPAVRCSPHAVGPPSRRRIELRGPGLPEGLDDLDPQDIGLEPDEAQVAETDKLAFLYLGGATNGVWEYEGGLPAWRENRAARHMPKPPRDWKGTARAQKRGIEAMPDDAWRSVFVNPYTFVPFPAAPPERGTPSGHRVLGASKLGGRIEVRWTALTPVLVRGRAEGGVHRFPTTLREGQQRLAVPGSSLKGAIRSIHEVLTGSCLRVVDLDFLPSYRDPAQARKGDWTLARVVEVDRDGRPTRLDLCDRVVWVAIGALHSVHTAAQLQSGSTVDVDEDAVVAVGGVVNRREVHDVEAVSPGDGWVVLVTDAGARSRPSYFAATGRLTGSPLAVTNEAWTRYQASVDGTDDVRRAQQHGNADDPELVLVAHRGQDVGRRYTAARRLTAGQVVWVRKGRDDHSDTDAVLDLALAAIWRHGGEHSLSERLPDGLAPCRDVDRLCPSCRVFGSADTEVAAGGAARQDGYRGHVRFVAAVASPGAAVESLDLPPMGAPRLGAGQFSLRPRQGDAEQAGEDRRPVREWGADPDADSPRMVRGRKFYWHADPALNGRHQRRRWQERNAMTTRAEVAPAGTAFETVLTFENLTPAEVGGLLAAVDPSLVLSDVASFGAATDTDAGAGPQVATRLGGGRPLGLGSVNPEIVGLDVHTAHSRYGGESSTVPSVGELVAAFADQVPEHVRATWVDVAAVLDVGHVNPAVVWYPPGATWDHLGERSFDEGYEFWTQSAGRHVNNDEPMVGLADPRFPDQYLDIVERRRR